MNGQTITLLEHPLRLDLINTHGQLFASLDWPQPKNTKNNRTSINLTNPPYRLTPKPTTPNRPRSHDTQPSQKS